MPRKPLIRTDEFPYHISMRSNHKHWFSIPLDRVWRICEKGLLKVSLEFKVEIFIFVLMDNHYHLLIQTLESNIDEIMYTFNKYVSQEIRKESGLENRMFGGRYRWSLVSDQNYFYNVYKYVARNPVAAGISKTCSAYPFSTWTKSIQSQRLSFRVRYPFDQSFEDVKKWIEEEFRDDEEELLRTGLKKTEFKIPISRTSRNKRALSPSPFLAHG